MMGVLAFSPGLGQVPAGKRAGSIVSTGLLTAAAVDPEPISKAILGIAGGVASLFTKLFGFGYNPRKLADTAITEAMQVTMNQVWYALTGEALNGVTHTADPGQYGKMHFPLFTASQYPSVPKGPLGDMSLDVDSIIQQITDLAVQQRAQLKRPESYTDFDANVNGRLALLNQVKQDRTQAAAQAPNASAVIADIKSAVTGMNWEKVLPIAIGGLLIYSFVF